MDDIKLVGYHDDQLYRGYVMLYRYETEETDFDKVNKIISEWAKEQGYMSINEQSCIFDKKVRCIKPVEGGYDIYVYCYKGGRK